MNTQARLEKNSPAEAPQRARIRGKGGGWVAFALLLLLILAALGLILYHWEDISLRISQPLLDEERAKCQARLSALSHKIPEPPPHPSALEQPSETMRRWTELTGAPPQWPQDLLEPGSCTEVEQDFRALCEELDRKPYLQGRLPAGGSMELFSGIARQLSANLPVASGEMRLPGAVVANVFHLFRVVGRDRLEVLKRILLQEQALSEPAAIVIYRWLAAQEKCWRENSVASSSSLEEYAAFFLNTLGGQGYLRRRPPKLAALTGFYSLVVLEGAALAGRNPHGLDLGPHIAFFRELIKSQELVFKDRYLEILSNMEVRWKDLSKTSSETRRP